MFRRRLLLALSGFSIILLTQCSPAHRISKVLQDDVREDYFLGLVVYDPVKDKEYINIKGSQLFTPASNTKLYTFYTAYKVLGDSVPMLEYAVLGDSLIIRGTADPSLLYLKDSTALFEFMEGRNQKLYLADATIDEAPYGAGWAWDDYQDYYQVEKSLFPLYGNLVRYEIKDGSVQVYPDIFDNDVQRVDSLTRRRKPTRNTFFAEKGSRRSYAVPVKTSNELTAKLLADHLGQMVELIPDGDFDFRPHYRGVYDTLYKQLLQPSDNFVAEQLLLQVGKKATGNYSVSKAIDYSLEHILPDLPQSPKWVDGSGLSRYNLFSPNDNVYLLTRMLREIPFSKLQAILPAGGVSGTLRSWYGAEMPYVFAKSGSLANNHNLSGYLLTKKGNILIFSYMNNHYTQSNTKIKQRMQRLFEFLRDHY
jgi:D-alanyl-D-alanine carboxypeptidase/D-alanyl-D-alanine-endopeptidase (penicillin-binding protein 4)